MALYDQDNFPFDDVPAASLSRCSLIMKKRDGPITEEVWKALDERNAAHRQWYTRVVWQPHGSRPIAWKTENPFTPNNIFVRSLDTGRMLKIANAPIRLQF